MDGKVLLVHFQGKSRYVDFGVGRDINDSGLDAECTCDEPEDDWWQDEPFSYNDLPDHDY